MSELFDEVLHDQNDEKNFKFFKKLLPIAAIITITIIIYLVMSNRQQQQRIIYNAKATDLLLTTSREKPSDTAIALLKEVFYEDKTRVAELIALELVKLDLQNHKISEARAQLKKIIGNTNYYEITTSYAKLLWLSLALDKEFDKDDKALTEKFLQYFEDQYKPFFFNANIIKAIYYTKNNQNELAIKTLSNIISLPNASGLIREQAKALLSGFYKNQ